jgi:taurine transport system ATP-binding protein
MRARVGVAQLLANDPKFIVMDNLRPLSAKSREVLSLMLLLNMEEKHIGVLLVSNIGEEALLLASRIIVLGPEGRRGPPAFRTSSRDYRFQ